MMHRTVTILPLLVLLVINGLSSSAQQKKQGVQQNTGKASHVFKPSVYLGHSESTGGPIKKEAFSSLMRQGLTSHDSLGNKYRVVGFDFGYAERNLYEDSMGNLLPMVDFSYEHCIGDTLSNDISHTKPMAVSSYLDGAPDSSDISRSIYTRAKPGDTIYFDKILVAKYINATQSRPDSDAILGKSMKFWIVR